MCERAGVHKNALTWATWSTHNEMELRGPSAREQGDHLTMSVRHFIDCVTAFDIAKTGLFWKPWCLTAETRIVHDESCATNLCSVSIWLEIKE